MKIFQYVAFYNPAKKDSPEKAVIIFEPKTILAKDEREAMMRAARDIPEKYIDKLNEVEIAVRPF